MNISDTFNDHPNFTILTPGACNAKYEFCFWNHQDGKIKPPSDYGGRLIRTLLALPAQYRSISISGGEPTRSPHLLTVLNAVATARRYRAYDRVVLTTNGSNLDEVLDCAPDLRVDFINISRHHYRDDANQRIFRTRAVPTAEALQGLVGAARHAGIPVTLNCVIDESTDRDFILQYIDFAHRVGVGSVSFRKEASTITPTAVEEHFQSTFPRGPSNDCPVCRGATQRIFGMEVRWKGSVTEPSVECGKTYEGVFHPDGKVYADWARHHPLEVPRADRPVSQLIPRKVPSLMEKLLGTDKARELRQCQKRALLGVPDHLQTYLDWTPEHDQEVLQRAKGLSERYLARRADHEATSRTFVVSSGCGSGGGCGSSTKTTPSSGCGSSGSGCGGSSSSSSGGCGGGGSCG